MPLDEAGGRESVEIRSFRGTRRTSVFREHVLSENAFARILALGERQQLPLLSSLDKCGPHKLTKAEAQQLADEAGSLRSGGELRDLDADLTALAEVARWCARASGDSWMKIEGP